MKPNALAASRRTPFSESSGNEDAVGLSEMFFRAISVDVTRIDPIHCYPGVIGGSGVSQSLIDRLVGILQFNVFSNDRDSDIVSRIDDPVDHIAPGNEIGCFALETEPGADDALESFLV